MKYPWVLFSPILNFRRFQVTFLRNSPEVQEVQPEVQPMYLGQPMNHPHNSSKHRKRKHLLK
jgi:hypothetical protein